MSISIKAEMEIDTGLVAYSFDEEIASIDYVDGTLPEEFLMHAWNTGKVYYDNYGVDPWIRRVKARQAMKMGESMIAEGDRICDITSTVDIGVDVILRMLEANMAEEV